jgi:polysaccharide biosynthesis/export protein
MIALATIVVITGCRTANYTASNLPEPLRVQPMPTASSINLQQMGSGGASTTQLGPGDLVDVTVVSGTGDDGVRPSPARVADDGTITVPLIGAVPVGGLEPSFAEQQIAAAAIERGIFRNPSVTVSVRQQATNRVTVMGAVQRPGVVQLPRGSSDLLSALAAAGGLKDEASLQVDVLRHSERSPTTSGTEPFGSTVSTGASGVQLASYNTPNGPPFGPPGLLPPPGSRREQAPAEPNWSTQNPQATRVDLAAANRPAGGNYHLGDRDMVMVHPKAKRVFHVTGLVYKPGQYNMPVDEDVRVLDAIAVAGGIKSPLADKVFVIRQFPDMPAPAVIRLSIAGAKRNGDTNLRLASGDLVSVEATPMTMISDAASNFFRVAIGLSGSIMTF